MRLIPKLVPQWPKLAWLAPFTKGCQGIDVYHGPMVEVSDKYIVEAVWDGDFAEGDFDRTSLVFGSGIRCRDDGVIFVSAGTAADRLWHCYDRGHGCVSNSLPALLATMRLSLDEGYSNYADDIATVMRLGIRSYIKSFPTDSEQVNLTYFNNLAYDGQQLKEIPKPDDTPSMRTYHDYENFLIQSARRLGANLSSPVRKHTIVPLVGISSGYDSPAVAVVARYAGCTQSVTIKQSRSLWRGSDSGETIANHLNLSCRAYDRVPKSYPYEVAMWATTGIDTGFNMTVFDYPEPLCLFFTGNYGDKVWDRSYHDFSEPIGDCSHLLGEFRLLQGMFQSVVSWWGISKAQAIHAIGSSKEMEPWTLHTEYDRPIARRLVEEAGVPRETFAIRKKNTASNTSFPWPFSPDARASFAKYLKERGHYVPPGWLVNLIQGLSHLDKLVHRNVLRRLGFEKSPKDILMFKANSLQFQWANSELSEVYERGLKQAGLTLAFPDKHAYTMHNDNDVA